MNLVINDIERLPEAAAQFIKEAVPGRVYAFYAPMGAGKTTFISEVCRQLGCGDEPGSPTFSIVNEYDTDTWGRVLHLDCYRINTPEEAFDIGIEEYFSPGNTAFVEWPENVEHFLPENTVTVQIDVDENGRRRLLCNL